MKKFQVVLMDGTVKDVTAIGFNFHDGFVFFYGDQTVTNLELAEAFALSTVKSFSQLPAGAA
jgi:hypothetical protein